MFDSRLSKSLGVGVGGSDASQAELCFFFTRWLILSLSQTTSVLRIMTSMNVVLSL